MLSAGLAPTGPIPLKLPDNSIGNIGESAAWHMSLTWNLPQVHSKSGQAPSCSVFCESSSLAIGVDIKCRRE